MEVTVIGIDCATDDAKIGVARGRWSPGTVEVEEVALCGRGRPPASLVSSWLRGSGPALIAMDAPLGWPQPLARVLSTHKAGDVISISPNEMFRRETDRFIQRKLGKTPLDVGADRIARTAHAALRVLGDIRTNLGAAIPLAWSTPPNEVAAIEVYPAATLLAHGLRAVGYKGPGRMAERREIISALEGKVSLTVDPSPLQTNADVLDAVVCLVAAQDFLEGRAMEPADRPLAELEGWIWASLPLQGSRDPSSG
jgi:hypothetical protein